MTVIINDFEIMVEPPASTDGNKTGGLRQESESTPSPELRPQDIERITRHFARRRERLLAD